MTQRRSAEQHQRYRAAALRRNADPAFIARLSAACKKRGQDPTYRKKMQAAARRPRPGATAAMVKRWQSPDYRTQRALPRPGHSEAMKRKWEEPEYRTRQVAVRTKPKAFKPPVDRSALLREMWKKPEYRAAVVASVKRARSRPEARAKQSAISKAMWSADPEQARRHAEAVVAATLSWHRYEYLDRVGRLWSFKSGDGWERGFARWLDEQELTWAYEPCTFLLSTGTRYTPDFWVQEWNTYVELKASHRSAAKTQQAVVDDHAVLLLQGRTLKEFYAWMAALPPVLVS